MNFKTFDLNLLRVLDALLATQSTTLAGQRLALSQPAVSAALARLRHALGDPLFIRQGRQLVPSDYATSLQAPLRSLLEQTESMLAGQPDFDPGASTDCLTLSGSDFYAELLMPRLARHLSRLAPGMRVQLVDLVPDNYVQSVGESGVDMAILPATETPDWVEQQRLHGSHFLTVARADHPEIAKAGHAPGEVLPLDLFCGLQHALFSPEGKLHGLGDAALARIGRARQVTMTLPVFSGVLNAVSQSDLIALIPHQLAESVAPRLGLSLYHPPIPVGPVEIILVWHKRASSAPAHRWLRDQIAMLMAELDTIPSIGCGAAAEPGLQTAEQAT
ncbi:LysR family transcriptional regulator [Ruegeria pomeroyi]|nr:LysR family transcriptional regulator [Ruegeria pomeroyi]